MNEKQLSRLNPGLGLHPNDIPTDADLKQPIDEKGRNLTRKERRYIQRNGLKDLQKFEQRKNKG